jgi:hypothetical protein
VSSISTGWTLSQGQEGLPLHLFQRLHPFLVIASATSIRACHLRPMYVSPTIGNLQGLILVATNELNREIEHFVVVTLWGGGAAI